MFEGPRCLYRPFNSKDCIVVWPVLKKKPAERPEIFQSKDVISSVPSLCLSAGVEVGGNAGVCPQVFLTGSHLFHQFPLRSRRLIESVSPRLTLESKQIESNCLYGPGFWKERRMWAFNFSALHFLVADVKDRDWPQRLKLPCTCEMASVFVGLCSHFQCGFLGHSLRSWGRRLYLSLPCLFSAEETRPLTRCSGSPDKDNHVGLLVFRPGWF